MALKLVIFDLDGLMLDSERLNCQLYQEGCRALGLTLDFDVFRRTIGCPDEDELELYRACYPGGDAAGLQAYIARRYSERFDKGDVPVKPGLFELFDAIDQKGGIKKAVGTSRARAEAERVLRAKGVWDRLDGGAYADLVEHGKPAPDIFLKCCELFGVNPEDALVLEDSEAGILAAIRGKIPVIAVPDLIEPRPELLSRCRARCDSLLDVIRYIA